MKNYNKEDIAFINAAGAVYAWICACDGNVTVDESEGFAEYLSNSPYVESITHEDFVVAFSEILHAFEVNFEDGYNRALVRIEPYKFDKQAGINLIKVAREALVADEILEEAEENVIKELCSLLEIKEEDIL